MAPPPPLLALRDTRIGFGGAPLFDGVSVAIGSGDRTCLVGRNGSGTSTLLKALAGVVQPDYDEQFKLDRERVVKGKIASVSITYGGSRSIKNTHSEAI